MVAWVDVRLRLLLVLACLWGILAQDGPTTASESQRLTPLPCERHGVQVHAIEDDDRARDGFLSRNRETSTDPMSIIDLLAPSDSFTVVVMMVKIIKI